MTVNRQHVEVGLRSVPSPRFQPTGFPDLGPAEFPAWDEALGDWVPCVLVDSAQSMANRLEAVGWGPDDRPVADLDGLPYVDVIGADGDHLTSSRIEAHRLASAFVLNARLDGGTMKQDVLPARFRLSSDRAIDYRHVAAELFRLDPLSLLHGVFFSQLDPKQPRITRAVSSVIEAVDVREAHSGGVKRDDVDPSSKGKDLGGAKEGYGNVPYHRVEYTARRILLRWALDRRQLRSYGLSNQATELLEALAHWQLRRLLDDGLRLRAACEFEPVSDGLVDQEGVAIPPTEELAVRLRELVEASPELEGASAPLTVLWDGKK